MWHQGQCCLLELWFCPPGCSAFFSKHIMFSRRTEIHGMIAGILSKVFVNSSWNQSLQKELAEDSWGCHSAWTSEPVCSKQFSPRQQLQRTVWRLNNYTEPEELALRDIKKNEVICVSRDLTVCLSRARYWSQYSVFAAKNRIVIQTVKEKEKKPQTFIHLQ